MLFGLVIVYHGAVIMDTINYRYKRRIVELCKKVRWDYRKLEFVKAPIGGTNTSFFVSYNSEEYVLRIASNNSGILRIDRNAEALATRMASNDRIGLRLYYFDKQNGDMITHFSSGHIPSTNELKDINNLDKLITQLKKLHCRQIKHIFDPIMDIEKRTDRIEEIQELRDQKKYIRAMELYTKIKDKFHCNEQKYWGLCHNDPSNFNMLLGQELKLIDYEFAGMGNVFYDIACICGLWNKSEQVIFLEKYFGNIEKCYFDYIKYYTILELIWNGTWAYIKHLEENLIRINYLKWGNEQFELAINLAIENNLL